MRSLNLFKEFQKKKRKRIVNKELTIIWILKLIWKLIIYNFPKNFEISLKFKMKFLYKYFWFDIFIFIFFIYLIIVFTWTFKIIITIIDNVSNRIYTFVLILSVCHPHFCISASLKSRTTSRKAKVSKMTFYVIILRRRSLMNR